MFTAAETSDQFPDEIADDWRSRGVLDKMPEVRVLKVASSDGWRATAAVLLGASQATDWKNGGAGASALMSSLLVTTYC